VNFVEFTVKRGYLQLPSKNGGQLNHFQLVVKEGL
jgi:hypothetical protein